MSEVLMQSLQNLPDESLILVGGDFNLYTSEEPAYQELLSDIGPNSLFDPINMPGNWHSSSFPNKEILTQSTRGTGLDDGAGGGMDDRFDFVLFSEALLNSSGQITSESNNYRALGNNGECYNDDLLDCMGNNEVPDDIIRALYYMSDHLPVVFELSTDVDLGNKNIEELKTVSLSPNPGKDYVLLNGAKQGSRFELLSLQGAEVLNDKIIDSSQKINLQGLNPGIYFIHARMENGQSVVLKFIKA